jgi:class 3 adenylate cyclase/predicted ATPase
MTFEEVLDQALAMLKRRGRVTYKALRRQFQIDDAFLEDLKDEIIKGQRLAIDEGGEVLVWIGAREAASGVAALPSSKSSEAPPAEAAAPVAASAGPPTKLSAGVTTDVPSSPRGRKPPSNPKPTALQPSQPKPGSLAASPSQPKPHSLATSPSQPKPTSFQTPQRGKPVTPSRPSGPAPAYDDDLSASFGARADLTATPRPPTSADAERRQLTVMFCDLVDSTALSSRLDPEDLREVVQAYQATCQAVIASHEGNIAQYLGDGLLVYFGYPRAHEDDARHAVDAGLGILEAMAGLNEKLTKKKIRLAVRIGIHTGPVVVGDVGAGDRRERLAVGETPNIAARIQGLARPDTVLMSGSTQRIVRNAVKALDIGTHALKGITAPVRVHQVVERIDIATALGSAAQRDLASLVGREREFSTLVEAWRDARRGSGRTVLLSGEPGIGKSRLVAALQRIASDEGGGVLAFRCSSYHAHTVLHPVIEYLQRLLEFRRDEPAANKLTRLAELVRAAELPEEPVVPLFAELLSLPLDGRFAPVNLTPERLRQRTQEWLVAWFLRRASKQALVVVVEDLHWADPSTLDLLGLLDQSSSATLMSLVTFRPEFRSPWKPRPSHRHVNLERLSRSDVDAMVRKLAGGKALPTVVVDQIANKTDGVPLFVEEVTKLLLESGLLQERHNRFELTGPLPAFAVPTTLHDSLMARLDKLVAPRQIAQLGATLGREFTHELMGHVATLACELSEDELRDGLRQLVEAEILVQAGAAPWATYSFRHALIQDVAYQSLLKTTRVHYHTHVAAVLASRFPEIGEAQPELLAHHYSCAGLAEPAVQYWQHAGERALQRSAYLEGIAHLERALELVTELPESERTGIEIRLQITLGMPLAATKGYSSPEVEHAYGRARALCHQLGKSDQLFDALYGLWRFYLLRADYDNSRELAIELLALIEGDENSLRRVETHRALGSTLFYMGELESALQHIDEVIGDEEAAHVQSLGIDVVDILVACRSYRSWLLWLLGEPENAVAEATTAIARARAIDHPFSISFSLCFASWLHQFLGDTRASRAFADEALRISGDQGFGFWVGWATVMLGYGDTELGASDEGILRMRAGLDAWCATGSRLGQSYFLALLSQASAKRGRLEDASQALDEAQAFADQTNERWWQPELHRLRGELILVQGGGTGDAIDRANAAFKTARDLATEQHSMSLRERASRSMEQLKNTA